MKLKTPRPWLRDWFSVLIGPAIWLALLLLVAGRNAYPAEVEVEATGPVADPMGQVVCVELPSAPPSRITQPPDRRIGTAPAAPARPATPTRTRAHPAPSP